MLDILSKAWAESKLKVLLVAAPIILILLAALFLKVYRSYLVSSAQKLLEKTLSKDKILADESNVLEQSADEHKAKADELAKKADAVEDDKDWNKKI